MSKKFNIDNYNFTFTNKYTLDHIRIINISQHKNIYNFIHNVEKNETFLDILITYVLKNQFLEEIDFKRGHEIFEDFIDECIYIEEPSAEERFITSLYEALFYFMKHFENFIFKLKINRKIIECLKELNINYIEDFKINSLLINPFTVDLFCFNNQGTFVLNFDNILNTFWLKKAQDNCTFMNLKSIGLLEKQSEDFFIEEHAIYSVELKKESDELYTGGITIKNFILYLMKNNFKLTFPNVIKLSSGSLECPKCKNRYQFKACQKIFLSKKGYLEKILSAKENTLTSWEVGELRTQENRRRIMDINHHNRIIKKRCKACGFDGEFDFILNDLISKDINAFPTGYIHKMKEDNKND